MMTTTFLEFMSALETVEEAVCREIANVFPTSFKANSEKWRCQKRAFQ
jgi:hypothetical protein